MSKNLIRSVTAQKYENALPQASYFRRKQILLKLFTSIVQRFYINQCDLTDLTRLALMFNSTPLQVRRYFRLYIVLLEKKKDNMFALYYVAGKKNETNLLLYEYTKQNKLYSKQV